jgi:hypothetical protein
MSQSSFVASKPSRDDIFDSWVTEEKDLRENEKSTQLWANGI